MSRYRELAAQVIAGRRWIVAMDVAQPTAKFCAALMDLGAEDVLGIATGMGTGPMPVWPEEKLVVMNHRFTTIMGGIRGSQAAMQALPAEVLARIEAFDPNGEACFLRPFFGDGRPIAGRRVWAARPEAWQALEDKVVIDAFWKQAGIAHAEFAVVPVAEARAAASALDRGEGTVWAGDAREGFNGGATYTRWIRTAEHAEQATAWFGEHCELVRVMPFLDGLPCSIHGLVAPGDDHLVAIRPMEMMVLRGPQGFVYGGAAHVWEPAPAVRDAMRETARKAAAELRARYDYRGAFTLDGVLTRDGFLPTELNPRMGAALKPCDTPEVPLTLLVYAMIEGAELDWQMKDLERVLLTSIAEPRPVYCGFPLTAAVAEERSLELDGVTVHYGPAPNGSYLRIIFDETAARGPSLAPRVARVVQQASAAWGLNLGPLEPAPAF